MRIQKEKLLLVAGAVWLIAGRPFECVRMMGLR